jgi:hypothetical protein
MVLNRIDPDPVLDTENSTIHTAITPPEIVVNDLLDDLDPLSQPKLSASSVPWPGSTFIIRSVTSGDVITLRDGKVVLDRPGSRASFHWVCVETKGWLGFRNPISSRFLGHDKDGKLCCAAVRHQGWENFCVRMTPEGGYILLMTHFERLWNVGIKMERGAERLAKVGEGRSNAIEWEFVKV